MSSHRLAIIISAKYDLGLFMAFELSPMPYIAALIALYAQSTPS